MQFYFYSWIHADSRTNQEEKDILIKTLEQAENEIKKEIDAIVPDKSYVLFKENKTNYTIELRELFDQEKLREIIRKEVKIYFPENLDWSSQKIDELLHFEK